MIGRLRFGDEGVVLLPRLGVLFNPYGVVNVLWAVPRVSVAMLPAPAAIIVMTPMGSGKEN